MSRKIYVVDLTDEEQETLLNLIQSGKKAARKINRAQILLLADEGKIDKEIAQVLHTSKSTVQRTRQRFVEGGLENALNEQPRMGGKLRKKLDEKGEVILETLACSNPPEGRKSWTLQLLADRLVELKVVGGISSETVRRELKKRNSSLG